MANDPKQSMPQTPVGPMAQYAIEMDELRKGFMAAGFSRSEAMAMVKIHWTETIRVIVARQAADNDSAS